MASNVRASSPGWRNLPERLATTTWPRTSVPTGTTVWSCTTRGWSSTASKRSPATEEALDSPCCNRMVMEVPAGMTSGVGAGAGAGAVFSAVASDVGVFAGGADCGFEAVPLFCHGASALPGLAESAVAADASLSEFSALAVWLGLLLQPHSSTKGNSDATR